MLRITHSEGDFASQKGASLKLPDVVLYSTLNLYIQLYKQTKYQIPTPTSGCNLPLVAFRSSAVRAFDEARSLLEDRSHIFRLTQTESPQQQCFAPPYENDLNGLLLQLHFSPQGSQDGKVTHTVAIDE
jgi:hypothetical protein